MNSNSVNVTHIMEELGCHSDDLVGQDDLDRYIALLTVTQT